MNIKRIFGSVLTVLGIIGMIYTAVIFVNTGGGIRDIRALVVYGLLGIVFFISGISLVRSTKDES
jgi:predicted Na+-dependent transporter